jgi:hypothetical protein
MYRNRLWGGLNSERKTGEAWMLGVRFTAPAGGVYFTNSRVCSDKSKTRSDKSMSVRINSMSEIELGGAKFRAKTGEYGIFFRLIRIQTLF